MYMYMRTNGAKNSDYQFHQYNLTTNWPNLMLTKSHPLYIPGTFTNHVVISGKCMINA